MHYRALALIAAMVLISPTAASSQTFAGPHAEAIIGWNHLPKGYLDRDGDGVTYGGSVGYDINSSGLLAGALAELTDASGSKCGDILVGNAVAGTGCVHNGRSILAGARLGVMAGEHTLFYALGGYARVRQELSYVGKTASPYKDSQDERDRDGYRLGAGIEQIIAGKAFLKAEYRYTDVKSRAGQKVEQHQLITGLGVRF